MLRGRIFCGRRVHLIVLRLEEAGKSENEVSYLRWKFWRWSRGMGRLAIRLYQ
jgi:hypothetical protein